MFWIAAGLFFAWLSVRELRGSKKRSDGGFYLPYFLIVVGLTAVCLWQPLSTWRFERRLASKATLLADGRPAKMHCNTAWDMIFSPAQLNPGYANPQTGEISFQKPWCSVLRRYLRKPQAAGNEELFALDMFTHEAMHVRGELNESVTECQAVQRNYRAARLLGVPEVAARRNAADFYKNLYPLRKGTGYYSDDCAPGKALDEHLIDSTWAVMADPV